MLQQRIEKLRVVGSLLMIAAHPDDENNRSLAYYAQGRKLRTAYLSLTRGEGGQNLIGSEQGALLGVIRTQELLMARRVDGAEQYFSRAIDFGFSKTAAETLQKWGREEVLSDIVWRIRKFRPDVIVLSFTGTPRDGHGHHQASAILAKEAFHAAADPKRFPEQLTDAPPWQAKRVIWNTFFGRARDLYPDAKEEVIDTGEYNPALGLSYSEIGAWSRTQHRSQGQGFAERKGSAPVSLIVVDGAPMQQDFMDGIDTSWNRLPGGAAVDAELHAALAALTPADASAAVPHLLKARALMAAIDHPDARLKLPEIWTKPSRRPWDCGSTSPSTAPRPRRAWTVQIELTAVQRAKLAATVVSAQLEGMAGAPAFPGNLALPENEPKTAQVHFTIPADQPPSQPYWLRYPAKGDAYDIRDRALNGLAENPPMLILPHPRAMSAARRSNCASGRESLHRPRPRRARPAVRDPAGGVDRDAREAAAVPGRQSADGGAERPVERAGQGRQPGAARSRGMDGAAGQPAFRARGLGESDRVSFHVTPPANQAAPRSRPSPGCRSAHEVHEGIQRIDYEHIPPQMIQSPAPRCKRMRADVRNAARAHRLRDGLGRRGAGCAAAARLRGHAARPGGAGTGQFFEIRRHRHRRPRLKPAGRPAGGAGDAVGLRPAGGTVVMQYNLTDTCPDRRPASSCASSVLTPSHSVAIA